MSPAKLLLLFLALVCPVGAAVAAEPAAASPAAGERPRLEIPEAARARPGFEVERATEAYLDLLTPEKRERSESYFEGGYVLNVVDSVLAIGISLLLLAGGRARRVRDALEARLGQRFLADLATGALYLLSTSLLTLPYSLYRGYFREHAYGLSNHTLPSFLGDWAKAVALDGFLFGPLAIALFYAVARKAPRTWWIWGGAVGVAMLALILLVVPVFIAPMFNRYEQLEPGPLRDRIVSLAHAQRVPADDVFWFDASRQTKRISANVSGLAGTTRISLNDNLLRRSPQESILAVLGHEIGHYVLNHGPELLLEFGLLIAAGFAFVHFGFDAASRKLGASWRLRGLTDPAGLPLATALLSVFFLLATPVTNTIIRVNEAEADAFGIAASQEPDGFAFVAVQLAEYRKLRPGPLEEFVFYDHPSGYDRVRRAMEWKAEHLDQLAAREAAAEAAVVGTPTPP